jgi:hypothetical protein
MKSNLGHEQVLLQHPVWEDLLPSIDVEIAPLITACWKLGIMTQQCCWLYTERQESWIQFASSSDAIAFLTRTIDYAREMRIVTQRSGVARPEVWFPHFEIPVLVAALNGKMKIPM